MSSYTSNGFNYTFLVRSDSYNVVEVRYTRLAVETSPTTNFFSRTIKLSPDSDLKSDESVNKVNEFEF